MTSEGLNQENNGIEKPMDRRTQRGRLWHLVFGGGCQVAYWNRWNLGYQGQLHRPLIGLKLLFLVFSAANADRQVYAPLTMGRLKLGLFGENRLALDALNILERIATGTANGIFQRDSTIRLNAEDHAIKMGNPKQQKGHKSHPCHKLLCFTIVLQAGISFNSDPNAHHIPFLILPDPIFNGEDECQKRACRRSTI
jgi:hypothetical protein